MCHLPWAAISSRLVHCLPTVPACISDLPPLTCHPCHALACPLCLPADPDLASQVVQRMPPLEEWRRFIYCSGMGAEVLGRVDHFK